MSFYKDLKGILRPEGDTSESAINESNPLFVYVKMPVDLDPLDRQELFAEPLQEVLERERLGTVTGGGSMSAPPDEDGDCETEFSGIDIDLYDPGKGLDLLRRELVRLEAPPGTVLVYELNGQEWQDPVYPPKPS
jgi:hypothetical protein